MSDEDMRKTYGLPDEEIWETLLPLATPDERHEAFELCEQMVQERITTQDLLYPHAREILADLKEKGYTLTTASNCGVGYLELVLDTQQLRPYFTAPLCLESVHGRKKADILAEHFRHFDKSSAIMVGDRHTDIEAADAFGVPTIGCAYGFGNPAELTGARAVIHSLRELPAVIAELV